MTVLRGCFFRRLLRGCRCKIREIGCCTILIVVRTAFTGAARHTPSWHICALATVGSAKARTTLKATLFNILISFSGAWTTGRLDAVIFPAAQACYTSLLETNPNISSGTPLSPVISITSFSLWLLRINHTTLFFSPSSHFIPVHIKA